MREGGVAGSLHVLRAAGEVLRAVECEIVLSVQRAACSSSYSYYQVLSPDALGKLVMFLACLFIVIQPPIVRRRRFYACRGTVARALLVPKWNELHRQSIIHISAG